MSDDEIKMNITTQLTDSNGQPLPVQTQQPEYLVETFSWDGINRGKSTSSEIITANEE